MVDLSGKDDPFQHGFPNVVFIIPTIVVIGLSGEIYSIHWFNECIVAGVRVRGQRAGNTKLNRRYECGKSTDVICRYCGLLFWNRRISIPIGLTLHWKLKQVEKNGPHSLDKSINP